MDNADPLIHHSAQTNNASPGMPAFLPTLLDHIAATSPNLPIDPVIVQSVLLSVMAGSKHLLLRTREEDVRIVQNLTAIVSLCPFASLLGQLSSLARHTFRTWKETLMSLLPHTDCIAFLYIQSTKYI